MGRYNLLDEKWIMVLQKETGQTEKVSLKEVFAHAGEYYDLAGEMKTQDFAILRVLLAVLQTVFSRFDSEGDPYDFIEITKATFQQLEPVDQDDLPDKDPYFETWLNLWKKGEFPEIVQDYLEVWRDHFYLFDDKYSFYQVTPKEMEELAKEMKRGHATPIYGKNLNRTISESGNKIALFSPITEGIKTKGTKSYLQNDQLVRWLIMYQGYNNTSDKAKVGETKHTETEITYSKGWLYDLGGIYLKGHNLFETLMLNCILSLDVDLKHSNTNVQIPSWERSPLENVGICFHNSVDNIASLYTNWSRAISFDKDYQEGTEFQCFVGKLPEINHIDNFMEPMTCWHPKNQTKKNEKPEYIPIKHSPDEAVWRHFNVLMGIGEEDNRCRQPGIISWYDTICRNSFMDKLKHFKVTICTVSMRSDDNSNSWVPVDEIIDEIQMETAVLIDDNKDGWIEQINTLIHKTQKYIENTLDPFMGHLALIRLSKDDEKTLSEKQKEYLEHLKKQERERLYLEIDQSFRDWLYEIKETDFMNEKALKWYKILKKAISDRGKEIFENASFQDLKGIQKERHIMNIATVYNKFKWKTNNEFSFLREGGK